MKTLYRPVGLTEMKLILDAELRAFPPRLPEQPIFYPVLNKPYADQIAGEWNTQDRFSGFAGFVTEFTVSSPFIDQFEEQIVGAKKHAELWIPADDLEEMNLNLVAPIKLVDVFYGADYEGLGADCGLFENKSSIDQFKLWIGIVEDSVSDLALEVRYHWKNILLNFKHWTVLSPAVIGIGTETKMKVLEDIKNIWSKQFSEIHLLGSTK